MKNLCSLLVAALFAMASSERELPDKAVTLEDPVCGDMCFGVVYESEQVHHSKFAIYQILITVAHGARKSVATDGHIEIWDDQKFIFSGPLPKVDEESIPLNLQNKGKTKDSVLFLFQINPRYVRESWFSYALLGSDGSSEMNCVLRLRDFIKP